MTPLKLELREKALRVLVHGYLLCSVLFYVLFSLLLRFPPIAMVGGHVNYYAFLAAVVTSDIKWTVLRRCTVYLVLVIEAAYPILLLVFYLKAVIKKRYKPFGVLAIISIVFVIAVLIIAEICTDELFLPPAVMWYDILGNTVYCGVYFHLTRAATLPKPDIKESC